MGVSRPRASQIVSSLEDFGLVVRTTASGRRLALTDPGLAMLSRRDRTAVGLARKRWSVSPLDEGCPPHWRNVSGRRSRQLLRHMEHTGAVHGCMAALAGQARHMGWETVQLDPPIRASRYFRYFGGMRSIHPDAFGPAAPGQRRLAFLFGVGAEGRAPNPPWPERLAPYLRYFSSRRPTDDHGVQPSALVVFEDKLVRTHFLRLAREEMQAARVQVSLWVSHSKAIDVLGPLGRAWRAPGDWDSHQALPPP